jgi:hypothetical protein
MCFFEDKGTGLMICMHSLHTKWHIFHAEEMHEAMRIFWRKVSVILTLYSIESKPRQKYFKSSLFDRIRISHALTTCPLCFIHITERSLYVPAVTRVFASTDHIFVCWETQ